MLSRVSASVGKVLQTSGGNQLAAIGSSRPLSQALTQPKEKIPKSVSDYLGQPKASKPVEEQLDFSKEALRKRDYFQIRHLIKMEEMFDARVYMGHKIGTINELMKPYIYGERLGHLVIDLNETQKLLFQALNFAAHIAFRNGIILFVNKSSSTGHLVEQIASNCGEYAHCREWRVGSFTDSTNFFEAVTRLPDLLIFLNTMNNVFEIHPGVPEAAKLLIPSIGIVDTNSNPSLITYPVPGNDDTPQAIEYYCRLFEKAIQIGKNKRKEFLEAHKPEKTSNS